MGLAIAIRNDDNKRRAKPPLILRMMNRHRLVVPSGHSRRIVRMAVPCAAQIDPAMCLVREALFFGQGSGRAEFKGRGGRC